MAVPSAVIGWLAIKALLCVLFCCSKTSVNGQELVPNGGFETYNDCPLGLGDLAYTPNYNYFPSVQNWVRTTFASSDYFNGCAYNRTASIPHNYLGYQPAHSGNAYAGIYAYDINSASDYREYISTRLSRPMVKDSAYCVRFFVSPAAIPNRFEGRALAALKEIGASFTDTLPVVTTGFSGPLSLPYHIINDTSRYLSDTGIWYEISGIYTARGGEEWMTIGTFGQQVPQYILLTGPAGGVPTSYHYIDDVSIMIAKPKDSIHQLILCDSAITLTSSMPAGPYKWNTGATTRSIQVTAAGNYSCQGLSCHTFMDRFSVLSPPRYDSIHDHQVICIPSRPILELTASRPSGRYRWNTGATARTLTINRTGTFICTTLYNCVEYRDIFTVVADSVPAPIIRDTTICQHVMEAVLRVRDTGLIWYLQVTDDSGLRTQPPIPTAQPGDFTLWVARQTGNCISAKVPLHIMIKGLPQAHDPATLLRCDDGARQYQVMGIQLEPEVQYAWNTGDSACCIIPQIDGRYLRTARNSCGLATDTFYLRSTSCDSCVVFPNAFSPNGDGVNDGFRGLEICPVKGYRLRIYDRWGGQVFETDRKDGRWDGRFKGAEAPAGTYMYYATFTTILSDKKQLVKGSVILFR